MAAVSVLDVRVLQNPAAITDPYQFEITFECLERLQKDLEWKLTYVGSATSSEHDQELDSLLVGPIPVGVNKFVFEADPPNLTRIPDSEILGVTVILLTCSYDGREFIRVGYYVNNEYAEEGLNEDPPAKPILEKIRRNILDSKPRVTRFAIKWDSEESAPAEYPPDQPEADLVEEDGFATYGADEEEEEETVEAEVAKEEGEDAEMGGAEDTAAAKDEDEASDAGSEDLEGESSGDEEDEEEEEAEEGEGDGDGDEEMDMGDGVQKDTGAPSGQPGIGQPAPAADVMVH